MSIDKEKIQHLLKEGKHFCVLPWIHFHAWPDKKVLPCCVADSSSPVSETPSENQTILDMMNSEEYKKVRLAMLEDQRLDICTRCYDVEHLGTWTMRQSHNTRRGEEYLDYIAETTNEDGSLKEFKMAYMDIRFSNLCNMKCRSCGPGCSSQWAQEYATLYNNDKQKLWDNHRVDKIIVNNNDDLIFMNKLKDHLKDVQEVYFAGGEIIIQPEHYECLDFWIENNLTDQVELTYTTNFSNLQYKKDLNLVNLWKKFPKLKIWASLDGEGKHAEIIRKGTDWDKIVDNIHMLKREVPHAEFQITPTISIWNVFKFPDFFDSLVDQKLIDVENSAPRINLLTYPWWANIQILPAHIRHNLAKRYKISRERYQNNVHVANGFKMLVYALYEGETNKDGLLQFIEENNKVDLVRSEKLLDVVPELQEVYKWVQES